MLLPTGWGAGWAQKPYFYCCRRPTTTTSIPLFSFVLCVFVCVCVFVCRAVSLMMGGLRFTRRLPGEGLRELELDVCVVLRALSFFFFFCSFLFSSLFFSEPHVLHLPTHCVPRRSRLTPNPGAFARLTPPRLTPPWLPRRRWVLRHRLSRPGRPT